MTGRNRLDDLVAGVRSAVQVHADWATTADLVADQLRCRLGSELVEPDLSTTRCLHIEPDGTFSVLALVWQPGQITRIHDHLTWCAFGVVRGIEREELFDGELNPIGVTDNHPGDASGFAPPGDIHRVHNTTDELALSIHIYGTDIARIGSSVRRYYDQPVLERTAS